MLLPAAFFNCGETRDAGSMPRPGDFPIVRTLAHEYRHVRVGRSAQRRLAALLHRAAETVYATQEEKPPEALSYDNLLARLRPGDARVLLRDWSTAGWLKPLEEMLEHDVSNVIRALGTTPALAHELAQLRNFIARRHDEEQAGEAEGHAAARLGQSPLEGLRPLAYASNVHRSGKMNARSFRAYRSDVGKMLGSAFSEATHTGALLGRAFLRGYRDMLEQRARELAQYDAAENWSWVLRPPPPVRTSWLRKHLLRDSPGLGTRRDRAYQHGQWMAWHMEPPHEQAKRYLLEK